MKNKFHGDNVIRNGLTEILIGSFGLMGASLAYLNNMTTSYYLPLIFGLLTVLITGVFEFREYFNKKLYQIILTVILLIMGIVMYIRFSPSVDEIIYGIEAVLIITIIIAMIIYTPKTWDKKEKKG